MHSATQKMTAASAVMGCGVILMLVGLVVEPTRTLATTGMTLIWAGLSQSYWTTVFEFEASKRRWVVIKGVLHTTVIVCAALFTLHAHFHDWRSVTAAAMVVLATQLVVSLTAIKISQWTHPAENHQQ